MDRLVFALLTRAHGHFSRPLRTVPGEAGPEPCIPAPVQPFGSPRAVGARRAGRRIRMSDLASQIGEHMEVVGDDGEHVGTVDKVEGNRIKLTKRDDPTGSGEHYSLPLGDRKSTRLNSSHANISY